MSHLDQLLMTLCSFWIGARLNHYQYHLIWEPGCHQASFISNSQLSSQYHGLFFIKFSKIQWNLHQMSKILNSLIWYFDFWKLMDKGNLLNLKILNLILSKILKLIVEAFQNYFYKINIYIYLIYFGTKHENSNSRGDTYDHLISTKNRLEEVSISGCMWSLACSRFPFVPVHMKNK
jgi:hypothetical protein